MYTDIHVHMDYICHLMYMYMYMYLHMESKAQITTKKQYCYCLITNSNTNFISWKKLTFQNNFSDKQYHNDVYMYTSYMFVYVHVHCTHASLPVVDLSYTYFPSTFPQANPCGRGMGQYMTTDGLLRISLETKRRKTSWLCHQYKIQTHTCIYVQSTFVYSVHECAL